MRKLVVCNIMSLDGYDEGPGNNVMVLPMDASFDEYNLERIRAADTPRGRLNRAGRCSRRRTETPAAHGFEGSDNVLLAYAAAAS
jgi:hypothetical protein